MLVDHAALRAGRWARRWRTRPEDTYRALLEATAFGTRVIVETFRDAGVPVEEFVVAGGLAKNPLLMQIYADVTRLPLSVIGSEQGPALGSAIHAAVAAGAYADVRARRQEHGQGAAATPTSRTSRGRRSTTGCSRSTSRCTTTSAAATAAMRRLRAIRRDAVASDARRHGEREVPA